MATIDTQYIYSLGRVKELEKGLLSASNVDRVLESDDPFSVLRSIGFFKATEEHEEGDGISEIFRREHTQNRTLLHELIADSPLEDIFLLPYDIHNIKFLLKAKISGNTTLKEWPLTEGLYPKSMLVDAIYDELPSDLPSALLDDIRDLTETTQHRGDFCRIDYRLDRRLRALQLEIAQNAKSPFLVEYLQRLSDVQNITTIIRRKIHELGRDGLTDALLNAGTLDHTFLEKAHDSGWESMVTAFKPTEYSQMVADALAQVEQQNFLAILDACGSQYLIEFLQRAKQQTFGIEPVVVFYLARDHELKVVRTLWMGKAFDYAQEKLKLRTKKLY